MYVLREEAMVTKKIIVQNRAGIHARPSSLIVQTANKLTVSADGADEAEALAALEQLFAAKFEEE